MRPQGIPEDYIKMKAFLFSLDGAAKDWLYLQPILFNTWGDMKRLFLEKFFLASSTATIKKEICGIRQHSRETLHEKAPDLQYGKQYTTVCDQESQPPRMVNEIGAVDNLRLENQLIELTSLVRQLVVEQHQPNIVARVCGICTSVEHPTDTFPRVHLAMYCRKMATHIYDNKILIHCFQDSLTGAALSWYISSEQGHRKTWRNLAKAFLKEYKYNEDMAPDRSRLQNMIKKEQESFKEYIQRWRELAA
ncbi:hypothetical protein CR513_50802, partial [Mucuna pruriens]